MVNSGLCFFETPRCGSRARSRRRGQAADHEPLQVQLEGDAQVQELVVGGEDRRERARVRAAVQRLQDRRLDLEEAARVQELPHGADHARARDEDLARFGIGEHVQVALAVARLDVHQAVELLGQRAVGLREEPLLARLERELALLRAHERPARPDEVADLVQLHGLERLAERVLLQPDLQLVAVALERRERHLAERAQRHDAPRDAEHRGRLRQPSRRQSEAREISGTTIARARAGKSSTPCSQPLGLARSPRTPPGRQSFPCRIRANQAVEVAVGTAAALPRSRCDGPSRAATGAM
jgi:hypothetical protein